MFSLINHSTLFMHFRYHRRDRDAKNAEKKVLDLQAELADALAKLDDAENKKKHAEAEAAVSIC